MEKPLHQLDLSEARNMLHKKQVTSVELTKACLEQIKKHNDTINAFITVNEEEALKQAEVADKRLHEEDGELLTGVPFAVKDVIMTEGVETTASSNILKSHIASYNATAVQKILDQGAVMLGKLNCDAFAHGASNEHSDFGPAKNPWNTEYVPGGSSGGSAAALSAGMAYFTLGTDTGGSIRLPGSFCNLVGFKPTYGRVSRYGLMSMTSSTDCLSILARDANDTAAVLEVISGEDIKDATEARLPVTDFSKRVHLGLPEKLKIGIPTDFFEEGLEDNVREIVHKAIEDLKELGAEFVDIKLPHAKYGVPVYYIITPSELSSNLERYDGIRYGYSATTDDQVQPENLFEVYTKTRGKGLNAENKRRIMIGTHALSTGYYDAYYLKASKVRTKIVQDFQKAFKSVDMILTPMSPHLPFKIGEKIDDPVAMYMEDIYSDAVNLAGLPAASVPCGFAMDGDVKLPVGMQLIAKPFHETDILRTIKVYEGIHNWQKEHPVL